MRQKCLEKLEYLAKFNFVEPQALLGKRVKVQIIRRALKLNWSSSAPLRQERVSGLHRRWCIICRRNPMKLTIEFERQERKQLHLWVSRDLMKRSRALSAEEEKAVCPLLVLVLRAGRSPLTRPAPYLLRVIAAQQSQPIYNMIWARLERGESAAGGKHAGREKLPHFASFHPHFFRRLQKRLSL